MWLFARFSLNLEYEVFVQVRRANMTVTVTYTRGGGGREANFCPYFPHFLAVTGDMRYGICACNDSGEIAQWGTVNLIKFSVVKATLYSGAEMKLYQILYISPPIWIKSGIGDIHKNMYNDYEFKTFVEVKAVWKGLNEFIAVFPQIYCPIWVKFGTRDLHIMLLNTVKFRENWGG